MDKIEKKRIAENINLYIRLNGFTKRSFAKATNFSQATAEAILNGKVRSNTKFNKYIVRVTEKLGLDTHYFKQDKETLLSMPIHYQEDDEKIHIGDDKYNTISAMLQIGDVYYNNN
ncbi:MULTISPECIES: hypothetical protein [Listeria]|uniref:HTH cro/C1-type domain-containing protein n=2 Tax=Listeria TaxID=1637 RepID=A0A099WKR8_9LIST|nr:MULTISPECIES: hypothetical protein [Listeria]EUJ44189.1 hypothetical protein PRIP_10689 [Listeria riparia FSL S10-1204]KGL45492.1 hypothetical protein EP57_00395 [Listeria booriae]MBC1212227.1 hypothetical protein [Listeria booriae]MBC1225550.1 hypothetical protein [Listeria booriae]MBC1229641.1 hypothetical protein [Listeria booriae]